MAMPFTMAIVLMLALQQPMSGTIRGVVVDADGGTPLGRVSVRLQTDGRTTNTDERGQFEIADIAPGEHELYVSAVDFMLVKRVVAVTAGAAAELTIPLSAGTGAYTETVNVRGAAGVMTRKDADVAAAQTLASTELQQLRGLLTNDPIRAIHVLPGVATGDDFRSEFAVRGLSTPHMNFTFEGISSPFLVHTVQEVRETGSLAMVNGDVLDAVSLSSGAYPQRFGNRLGAELDFRMREGSRNRIQSHVSITTTDAALVAEGPIGRAGRGSWLGSVRKSYLDLVIGALYGTRGIAFGFEDGQAKLTYDLTPRHQLQVAMTAGQSQLNRDPTTIDSDSVQIGDNASAVAVATWRYLPSPRIALHQRVAFTTNEYRNITAGGVEIDHGRTHDWIYRAEWTFAPGPRLALEGGGELRSSSASVQDRNYAGANLQVRNVFDASGTTGSAYLQARWSLPGGASVSPGARIDHWTLTGHTAASPWVGLSWPLARSLTLRAGSGLYRQDPNFFQTQGARGTPTLDGQRAWAVDTGIEGLLGPTLRWQATFYHRADRDRIRLPGIEARVVNGSYVGVSTTSRHVNALDGYARGVELMVQRRSPNGLSGWISYAYGENRYEDRSSGESFWGDFDQRHTINMFGSYRLTDRMSASARFRTGSNFPAPGYYREDPSGLYFATDLRNTLRVPHYARLDMRVNRTFTWDQRRLTLFVEGMNLFNRENVRFVLPSVNRRTLQVGTIFSEMMPIVPSLGLLLEF